MTKCLQCNKPFKQSRAWQVFHGRSCRVKYHNANRTCFYCGYTATQKDHIWPVAKREHPPDTAITTRPRGETVPACDECNHILGAHEFSTIIARFEFVAKRYGRRHRKTKEPRCLKKQTYVLGRAAQWRMRRD